MKVLTILALLVATLWCIDNFIPGLFVTVGGILLLVGRKGGDDGIDKFFAFGFAAIVVTVVIHFVLRLV